MPEILRMFGIRFFFYSREHEPIHVHIKNADDKGIKPKDIKAAEWVLEENRELAISEWNKYFGCNK